MIHFIQILGIRIQQKLLVKTEVTENLESPTVAYTNCHILRVINL